MKNFFALALFSIVVSGIGSAFAQSSPTEKLQALCAQPLASPLYGMWRVNKAACNSEEMRPLVSAYAIVLPGSSASELEVYTSETPEFTAFQHPPAVLMSYASLFAVIRYPVADSHYFDLIFQAERDGNGIHIHGYKDWDANQYVYFGTPGGERYGCRVPGKKD